jgi:hypothetical protein
MEATPWPSFHCGANNLIRINFKGREIDRNQNRKDDSNDSKIFK